MPEPKREELKVHARRAVLVSVVDRREKGVHADDLDEMRGLAETAGAEIVGTLLQYKEKPDPATYLGKGKLSELAQLVAASDADLVVFDNVLSPSQGKNVEEITGKQVVDRSEVILDIFATHARTYESKLQVELAQLLYMRPRLTRMWTHLERIEGGIGSGKGPGEKQLETDRRLVDTRISELKRKLKDVEKRRERLVASRRDHMTVSLVGYTNAGKSTLMRALTGADVYIADKLFATLDTRTRKWTLPNWGDVLLSDTVGFIKNLPHHLVASFRSTLEEARHADLLLHVVDASHPDAEQQIKTVNEVLEDLGIEAHEPILVLNKVDALEDRSLLDVLRGRHPNTVSVSAVDGTGLEKLTQMVAERLGDGYLNVKVETSVGNGKLFAFLSEHAEVQGERDYHDDRVTLTVRIPRRFANVLTDDPQNVIRNLDGTPLKLKQDDIEDDEDYSVPLSASGRGRENA
ncbi:GTPase HflX [Caulifigura coniformis]|uniref:GTPase HflX n=1 Tax=Caulifigura coniformis TaxID=2527983 RepID=A0A517SKK8_9PLAN|nr:GTPase HflX [Caulifigura coniformis]QDT56654.1 GTPase HflX [Caulifigura coniformis]